MTAQPTRATVAGRAYLDLQNLARRTRRPTDELHQIYALEGFLARLVESAYADRLILKGGVLLGALDVRRPTRDVDFQGKRISHDGEQTLAMVKAIAEVVINDGLVLATDAATAEIIRDQDEYSSAGRLRHAVSTTLGDMASQAASRGPVPTRIRPTRHGGPGVRRSGTPGPSSRSYLECRAPDLGAVILTRY